MVDKRRDYGQEEFMKNYLGKVFCYEEETIEPPEKEFLGDYDYFKYEEEENE